MGFFDELKKLTRPYADEDEFVDEAEAVREPEERPRANPFSGFGGSSSESAAPSPSPTPSRTFRSGKEGKVVNLSNGGQMQVILVKPERFDTAAEIADHLRAKRAVLLNLEATPKDVVRRLVDFLSGVTYAIEGSIQKVAANTFILTPPNVDLVGERLEDANGTGVYF